MEPKKAPYTCDVCKALFSLRKLFFEHVQTCLENEKANKNANKQEDPLEIHEEKVRTTTGSVMANCFFQISSER